MSKQIDPNHDKTQNKEEIIITRNRPDYESIKQNLLSKINNILNI